QFIKNFIICWITLNDVDNLLINYIFKNFTYNIYLNSHHVFVQSLILYFLAIPKYVDQASKVTYPVKLPQLGSLNEHDTFYLLKQQSLHNLFHLVNLDVTSPHNSHPTFQVDDELFPPHALNTFLFPLI